MLFTDYLLFLWKFSILHKRFLVIFTRFFPYGYREPYLLNEIQNFSEHFTKIYIFVSERTGKQHIKLPENVLVVYFPLKPSFFDKLRGLRFILNPLFWRENKIQSGILSRSMRFSDFRKILAYYTKAGKIARLLRKFSLSNRVPLHKTIFFNTGFDERSLALVLLSNSFRVKGIFTRFPSLPEFLHRGQSMLQLFRAYVLKNMDATFFPTNHSLRYVAERYGVYDASRMMVMRPGTGQVERASFSPLKGKKIKLVSISFIDKYKRVESIIDALEVIEGIHIDWCHIGGDSKIADLNQKTFNRLLSKRNITFRFIGDSTAQVVNKILAEESPDVYISLSSSEDIPHSMLEALSYGIPVISTDVGGVSEVIKNGENGFLLPADPGSKEVAELLRQITTIDEAAWLQMRHNALETWHLMADASKQYQELCYLLLQMSRNYEQ